MPNVIVFAVIGMLAGAAARMFYPDRRFIRTLGTLMLGALGGVIGGLISWGTWPEVDSQFQTGNLIGSVIGAFVAIVVGAGVSYARGIRGYRNPAR